MKREKESIGLFVFAIAVMVCAVALFGYGVWFISTFPDIAKTNFEKSDYGLLIPLINNNPSIMVFTTSFLFYLTVFCLGGYIKFLLDEIKARKADVLCEATNDT